MVAHSPPWCRRSRELRHAYEDFVALSPWCVDVTTRDAPRVRSKPDRSSSASRDRVLVDSRVAEQRSVVLEAGSHERSVRLQTAGLLALTEAEIVDICKEE